jgi:hypothetical protein
MMDSTQVNSVSRGEEAQGATKILTQNQVR